MRFALALDLVNDADSIAAYEKAHEQIWPEVRDHLLAHGVVGMQIYRIGNRLFMCMEVNPKLYDPSVMAAASLANPVIAQWEAWMWQFQQPTPWTPAGEKWVEMDCVFNLASQF